MTIQKHSFLFKYIEKMQGARDWGNMLDAGTGPNSIRWVSELDTESWTAVTCSVGEAERTRGAITSVQRPQDRIVLGNWADIELLKGEVFDTVLAGYLLGAIEGFSPYFQSYLFTRLRPMTHKSLFVTGLEPYVPTQRPESKSGAVLWNIGRFRDSCQLLSGNMPYREYPAQWVVDNLGQSGFAVREVKHFSIGYKEQFVNAQIDMCTPGLNTLADQKLAQALKERGEMLRSEALEVIKTEGALRHARNYVVFAEPV